MVRKAMLFAALAIASALLASSAWASVPLYDFEITGKYFNPRPGTTTLCAELEAPFPWLQVGFEGVTPYGLEFQAGPYQTDTVGRVCGRALWPQGVYAVEAYAFADAGGSMPQAKVRQGELWSEEAAVSVFNPFRFCGTQGGGALQLTSYDVPPNVRTSLTPRKATYAYIFKQNVPQNYGVWYFDTEYPYGEVEFVAQSFTDIFYSSASAGGINYNIVEVYGNGYAELELEAVIKQAPVPDGQPVHYYIYADDYPGDSSFRIKFWDFAGNLLYQSAPEGEWDQTHVYDGKNVIQPCP